MKARHVVTLAAVVLAAAGCGRSCARSGGTDAGASGGGGLFHQAIVTAFGFEGEIGTKMTYPGVPTFGAMSPTMTMFVKGDRARFEVSVFPDAGAPPDMVEIVDTPAKKIFFLYVSRHEWSELPLPSTTSSADAGAFAASTTVLGTDTVAGYTCNRTSTTYAAGVIESCTAPDIRYFGFAAFGMPGAPVDTNEARALLSRSGGFPIRMVMKNASGVEQLRMEATRIDKKSLADSLFEIPPGYTRMTIPSYGTAAPATTGTP